MMSDEKRQEQPGTKAAAEAELRKIGRAISEYRQEFLQRLTDSLDDEIEEMDRKDFDPARGRGRGPRWADGA